MAEIRFIDYGDCNTLSDPTVRKGLGYTPYERRGADYQEEIAEKEGMTHQAIDLVLQEMAELPKLAKPTAEHLTDFEAPMGE